MLPHVLLSASSSGADRRGVLERAFAEAGRVVTVGARVPEDAVVVRPSDWARDDFDLLALDDAIWGHLSRRGSCEVHVADDGAEPQRLADAAWQVAVRFQRFEIPRNTAAATPLFDGILAAHEALFDRARPFIAADHDHALDTWRWLLRLAPDAGLPLQVAALFHDLERLVSEADGRIEHLAADYLAFKRSHAEEGARLLRRVLGRLSAPEDLIDNACALIAHHEGNEGMTGAAGAPAAAPLLGTADALSFFSLNAPGFLRHFGVPHTARKVAYTLARLDEAGRAWLARLKLTGPTRHLLAEAAAAS
jgi:hypothetical protein